MLQKSKLDGGNGGTRSSEIACPLAASCPEDFVDAVSVIMDFVLPVDA